MCMDILPVCYILAPHVCVAPEGQKRVSDLVEQQLQKALAALWVLETQLRSFERANSECS